MALKPKRPRKPNLRFVLAATLITVSASIQSQGIESCRAPEAWATLEELKQKYAGTEAEQDLQFLINYRKFLCAEAEAKRVPWDEARRLFEDQRNRILRAWRESNAEGSLPPT